MRRSLALLAADLLMVVAATLLAQVLRENGASTAETVLDLLPYVAASVAAAAIVFPLFGLHRTIWRLSTLGDHISIVVSVTITVLLAMAAGFALNRLDGVARTLPIIQCLLLIFLMSGGRTIARMRERRRSSGSRVQLAGDAHNDTPVVAVLVGLDGTTEFLLNYLKQHLGERLTIAGLVARSDRHTGRLAHQLKILGRPEELSRIVAGLVVHGVEVNRIYVTTPFAALSPEARNSLSEIESEREVDVEFVTDKLNGILRIGTSFEADQRFSATADGSAPGGVDFVLSDEMRSRVMARPHWKVKRLIDVLGSSVMLLATLPLHAIVAILVLIDIGTPVTFWQRRPGVGGRPFRLHKFRTMRDGIDENGQRIADEHRLSKLGRFLRRSRLDELPQLFQVLRGDMSLVGPRPLLPIDQPIGASVRLLVRPGITGFAQVTGGREISANEKIALDVWYVLNASLIGDIKMMLATVPMLLRGESIDRDTVQKVIQELESSGVMRRTSAVVPLSIKPNPPPPLERDASSF